MGQKWPNDNRFAQQHVVKQQALIGAGDRKGVLPMATRDGEIGYDQLHHFIASGGPIY
jgi:hypothetical protein